VVGVESMENVSMFYPKLLNVQVSGFILVILFHHFDVLLMEVHSLVECSWSLDWLCLEPWLILFTDGKREGRFFIRNLGRFFLFWILNDNKINCFSIMLSDS